MVNNILDLPLDARVLVFERIEALKDKKNFARAHPKLWEVIYHSRKGDQSKLHFNYIDRKLVENWKFLVEWWGPNLKSVVHCINTVNCGKLFKFAAKHCPNLEHLYMEVGDRDLKRLRENLPSFQRLSTIQIQYSKPAKTNSNLKTNKTIENLIKILQLKKLRHLQLNFDCSEESERKELNKLIHLESLDIERIKIEYLNELSELFGKLSSLQSRRTDSTILSHVAQHCVKLKKLTLQDYRDTSDLPYMPTLTHLKLRGYQPNFIDFISKLNDRYDEQLQVLVMEYMTVRSADILHITKLKALKTLVIYDILSDCISEIAQMKLEYISMRRMPQNGILKLINECSTLKELTCSCSYIDEEFLPKVLDLLKRKANGVPPDRRFKINICATIQCKRMFVNQLMLLPNPNLLCVHFSAP